MQQMARSSSDSMNMLRADLETSRQDLEIALLEQEAEINRLQLESFSRENEGQRAIIAGAGAMSLLVLTGLLFQWRSTRRIRELSHRDGLSGLYNRNYTFDYLRKVLPRINVESGGLSIFLLDVDNFKSINDRFGHPTGDAVIRKIAAIGEESLRNRDIMGRIGGEEFLCVLPRTTAAQSMQIAERLLDAISAETFVTEEGQAFSVSISIGVADYDGTVKDADDLYSRADKALYRAKTAGKGCIANFEPVPPMAAAAAS
jgi:diguanylate cyclase (GGDEF)-like protein